MVNIAQEPEAAARGAMSTAAHPVTGHDRSPAAAVDGEGRSATAARYLLAGIRLALGWVFLWAFLDKPFGLGFATPSERSWINGGSPTNGFLGNARQGPVHRLLPLHRRYRRRRRAVHGRACSASAWR